MVRYTNIILMLQTFFLLLLALGKILTQEPDQTKTSENATTSNLQDHCLENDNSCSMVDIQDDFRSCYCDTECIDYNDCCHDYNFTETRPTASHKHHCFPKVYESMPKLRYGFFAVNSCPSGYTNSTIRNKCSEDNISKNGIFVIHGKRLIFKNRFCAYCNGIVDFNSFRIRFYDIRFDHVDDFFNLTREEKLKYLVKHSSYLIHPPENAELRRCVPHLLTNNNSLCNAYISPVLVKVSAEADTEYIYRNYFCLPRKSSENPRNMVCVKNNDISRTVSFYSLSVLFSFEGENSREKTRYGYEQYSNLAKNIQLFWYSKLSIPDDMLQKLLHLSVWFFNDIDNFHTNNNNYYQIDHSHKLIKLNIKITFKKSLFLSEIDQVMEKLKHRSVTLFVEVIPSNMNFRFELKSAIPLELDSLNLTTAKLFGLTSRESTLESNLLRFSNIMIEDNTLDFSCLKLFLQTLYANGTLFIKETHCNEKRSKDNQLVPKVLTYVCFSLSIIALIPVLIIQRKNGLIDNPSSSNVENMSFAMLLSNFLFIIGIGLQELAYLCYVIGVFLHFLWLSVFSFTTVSVIYITKTLTRIKSREIVRYECTERLRIKLTIAGLTMPLALVLSTVALDNYGPSSLSAGYGSNACFPNNYPVNVIFFTGPVLTSVFFNLTNLCYMFCKICQVRLEASNIKRLNPYKDAIVYLRIVIISGIPWLSALLPVFVDNEICEIVFIILCGLHGLFLSVAVLTSTRVRSSMASSSKLSLNSEKRSASTRF